ncbi:MAG: hypothetical protein H6732_01590 [Alphaproteobacteria bacterium]|nr:hypothetical protein [Alphaproteobacteria bacterium]
MRLGTHHLPPVALAALVMGCAEIDLAAAPGNELPAADDSRPDLADPSGDGARSACTSHATWIHPGDSDAPVRIDTSVRVGIEPALPADRDDWSLKVPGVEGTALLSEDRRTLTFVPNEPLAHEQAYEIAVTVCDDVRTQGFRTLPPPVSEAGLPGRAWAVDLDTLTWVQPASVASFLDDLGLDTLVLSVQRSDGALELVGRLAVRIGSTPLPLPCSALIEFGPIDLRDNPRFVVPTTDIEVGWLGATARVEQLRLEGLLANDGATLANLEARAVFDTRGIDRMLGDEVVCDLSERFGEDCEACEDGEPACLPAFVSDIRGTAVSSNSLFDLGIDLWGLCP